MVHILKVIPLISFLVVIVPHFHRIKKILKTTLGIVIVIVLGMKRPLHWPTVLFMFQYFDTISHACTEKQPSCHTCYWLHFIIIMFAPNQIRSYLVTRYLSSLFIGNSIFLLLPSHYKHYYFYYFLSVLFYLSVFVLLHTHLQHFNNLWTIK